jgi:hypothetical protein
MGRISWAEHDFVSNFYNNSPTIIPATRVEQAVICPMTKHNSKQLTRLFGGDRKRCHLSGACDHSWAHSVEECKKARKGHRYDSDVGCPYGIECKQITVLRG